VAPPRRSVSNAGSFNSRIQSLVAAPPERDAPIVASGQSSSRRSGRQPPPPTRFGKNAAVASGKKSSTKGPSPPTGRNNKAGGSVGVSFRSTSGGASTIQGRTTVVSPSCPWGITEPRRIARGKVPNSEGICKNQLTKPRQFCAQTLVGY
jgi:hypothetical protein